MLKTSFSFPVTFVLFAVSLSSCTHYYYAPNAHNVPLFQKEKEARISVAKSGGDEFEAIEFQSAFSITKQIGIMANGFFVLPQTGDSWGKGNLAEIGVGYFKPIEKLFVFETYGGFGWGKVINQYEPGISSSVHLRRYFIQPSIGLTSKYIDIAFSSRFCGLEYHDIDYHSEVMLLDVEDLEYIRDNKFSFLFEPAFTVRGGWKYIKLQVQIGFSWNLSNPELKQEEINGNIGINIIITNKFKKGL